MGNLKGPPVVHFNFPLLSFSLYTTFKTGIAAACKPIPLEWGRIDEWLEAAPLIQSDPVGLQSGAPPGEA